jgi:hypothetical protein
MIYPKSVTYREDYKLEVVFSDGLTALIDLEQELYGPMFEPLKDKSLFRQVKADSDVRTLVWPNGADLAPEFLYELAHHPAHPSS